MRVIIVLLIVLIIGCTWGDDLRKEIEDDIEEIEEKILELFFDLAKATLRPNSFVELDKLASFLKENKEIVVEIGGHTDSRGSNNQTLSNRRAKAVYDYLVSKGIEEKQLTHKGYGSTQPIFTDEYISNLATKEKKEEAHQSNRRTEYKIISE